ncbi:MAG: FtsX-like permease family protein [Polyangiales bacterium]
MLTLLREISLRHFRHALLRTGLVVLGIALGVGMLCAILATNTVLSEAFEDMVDRVAGKADLTVAGSAAGIPSSLTGEIAEIEGVGHAAAMLEVVTRTADGKGGSLLVLGVDFLGDTFFLPFAQPGERGFVEDPLAFVNDPTAVLVSQTFAKTRGVDVGSTLMLRTSQGPTEFKVRGLLEDSGPAASFGGQVVVMFIDAAQVTFQRGYAVDRIDVVAAEGHKVADVEQRIAQHVQGRAKVEAPKGRTRRMVGALASFQNGLNMSGIIALSVGMFMIFNAVSISVAQRRREVGTLRALGVIKRKMVMLFVLEALVLGTIGTILGLALAQTLASFAIEAVQESVNRLWVPLHPKPPRLTIPVATAGALAGLFTTVFAAYLPSRATNQIAPAEALRATRSSVFARKIPEVKLALGGLCALGVALALGLAGGEDNGYLATGVVNLGVGMCVPLLIKWIRAAAVRPVESTVGIAGRLARDNVERSRGRSATTVLARMLAVGMSTSVNGYSHSFEKSLLEWADSAFAADAVISSGSSFMDREHLSFTADSVASVAEVPGVLAVDGTRSVQFDYGDRRMELHASDSRLAVREGTRKQRQVQVLEGPEKLAENALYDAPRALISENMASFQGLSVGDKIAIDTPTGRREFEVYAVVVDYSSDQGSVVIDRRWYLEWWKDELIDVANVYFEAGVQPEQVATAIRDKLTHVDGMFVTLQGGVREELREVARSVFAYARAPEIIALVVAIMGVIGTMLAAILDRIREIGMLRAIGATRHQVTMSLVAEAGFMGVTAAICGVSAGIPLGVLLVKVVGSAAGGWKLQYYFPVEAALRVSLLVGIAAALAGIFPGRKVAKLDVKEALSYE